MSFNELSIMVTVQNLASSAFNQVASDAGAMASQITGNVQSMGYEFAQAGSQAQVMGEGVDAGAGSLDKMGVSAEGTTVKLSTVARGISSVSGLGLGLTTLAGDFGLVDAQSTKWMRTGMAIIMVVSEVARLISYSTVLTTGHTAAVAMGSATDTANASASIASTVATNIRSAATWIATAAQNALNISQAMFLALTGVGIAVIIAAAGAMAYFASQMNSATSSVQGFNGAAAALPSSASSGVSKASLVRSGVEALG